MKVKFNVTKVNKTAQQFINDALFISGLEDEKYIALATNLLRQLTLSKKILLTHSCTAALEMAAILIDIKPGDEVIMPSHTFVSTANAFVLRGAVPVFVDIREDKLNLDETLIEAAITHKTKAIVPVHYAGVACEMDAIMAIAKKHNLYVIEDAAQCIGATYKGKCLGTIGHFGTLSFHYTKNITSGLGGALLINDAQFIERAKIIWQKGTNREAFIEGEVDKYTWSDLGSSFMMPELSAALLSSQLEQLHEITEKRLSIWTQYYDGLKILEENGLIHLPGIPEDCQHNGHIFYLICKSQKQRSSLMSYLKVNAIQTTFHYIPLHSSPAGKAYSRVHGDMTNTNHLADCLVRLPLHYDLLPEQAQEVIDEVTNYFGMRMPYDDCSTKPIINDTCER
jgi:dTDP-4-amino-4,6-dideoxygalactose transaminase